MRQAVFSQHRDFYHFFPIRLYVLFACFFLLTGLDLQAYNERKYDEAVSLGTACQGAWHLKDNGMRKWAYPLDWLITPFHGLVAFIQNRGEGFLEQDKLQLLEVLPSAGTSPSMLHVVDLTYDFHSIHDFFSDMSNYDQIKAKYAQRIQRFFELLESDKKVLLVRVQISRDEAIHLDAMLQNLYPHLDYTLLAVSDRPEAQVDWGLERIRNFYMHQEPGDWKGDCERWKDILSLFPVKGTKKKNGDGDTW